MMTMYCRVIHNVYMKAKVTLGESENRTAVQFHKPYVGGLVVAIHVSL